ncbi:MAG TPA: NAD(P)-dependent oxidoreductase [Bacteroidales bacterium]|nr:NAD(P)-dependent oxidoreductase [Bacteroidales bacterium]
MPKVLIATDKPFAASAASQIKAILEGAGYECAFLEKYTEKQQLLDAVAQAEALIIRSDIVDAQVVAAADKLKIVVRAGAGYDNIDLKACTEKGIVAMNTPGQNSNAVAELAFLMMLYQIRKHLSGASGTELMGKTLGIHAYGNVGKHVARIARGFHMDVYAYDPFVDAAQMQLDGVKPVSTVDELYAKCQFVSLHIPANEKTKKSIGFDLLSKMPKGAMLVNTARKEVIDEEGLKKMFEARKDFTYVSDIAPDCAAELEQYAGRYFFTPKKMGAQTEEANNNAGMAAAHQIIGFFEHNDVRFKVN